MTKEQISMRFDELAVWLRENLEYNSDKINALAKLSTAKALAVRSTTKPNPECFGS